MNNSEDNESTHQPLGDQNMDPTHQPLDDQNCECMRCRVGPENADKYLDSLIEKIGFAPMFIADFEPPFVYTIGLTLKGLPEIIIMGNFSADEFNCLVMTIIPKLVEHHADLLKTIPVPQKIPNMIDIKTETGDVIKACIGLGEVDKNYYEHLCGIGLERYEDNLRVIQIFIPDTNGKLKGDDGFNDHWNDCHAQQIPLNVFHEEVEDQDENSDVQNIRSE